MTKKNKSGVQPGQPQRLYSTAEVAAMHSAKPSTIRRIAAERGVLGAVLAGRAKFYTLEEAQALKPNPRGRPRKTGRGSDS